MRPFFPGRTCTGDLTKETRSTGRRWRGAIVHRMGVAIAAGEYVAGEQMPSETTGPDLLGVSRNAYREAIHYLVGKGMVVTRPKWGTRVLPRNRWNLLDPEVLSWIVKSNPSERFAREIFELVDVVAPAAASIAALRRNAEDLQDMRTSIVEMRRNTASSDARHAADQVFLAAVLRATGNSSLIAITESVTRAANWPIKGRMRAARPIRDTMPHYRKVYEAVAAEDAGGAKAAMRTLLQCARIDWALSVSGPFDQTEDQKYEIIRNGADR